jgi:hypothetical protein
MKSMSNANGWKLSWRGLLLAAWVGGMAGQTKAAEKNIVLWDTGTPLSEGAELKSRADWQAVPSELFVFEADPLKAASDPGYYGLEYSFQGDAVVENRYLTALFQTDRGRVVLFAKTKPVPPPAKPGTAVPLGRKILEFIPEPGAGRFTQIQRCAILRNVADEVLLKVIFGGAGSTTTTVLFSLGRDEIVRNQPDQNLPRIR